MTLITHFHLCPAGFKLCYLEKPGEKRGHNTIVLSAAA